MWLMIRGSRVNLTFANIWHRHARIKYVTVGLRHGRRLLNIMYEIPTEIEIPAFVSFFFCILGYGFASQHIPVPDYHGPE